MAIERDQFYIGERVFFDVDCYVSGALSPAGTVVLTIEQPDGVEVTPAVTISPSSHAHAVYDTTQAGWHDWRVASTGALIGAKQGRFRVLPLNV